MKLCYQQVGKGKNAILGGSQELFLQCKYFDITFSISTLTFCPSTGIIYTKSICFSVLWMDYWQIHGLDRKYPPIQQ